MKFSSLIHLRSRGGLLRLALLTVMALTLAVFAQQHLAKKARDNGADCAECHSCKNPTKDNPCLTMCPRPRAGTTEMQDSPETVLLYELENEYQPVTFNHRVHAEMSAMGGECASCHHYSEAGKIESCKQCHATTASDDMHQPGLKGAYHRQCMKCHEKWSGETNCELCHAKKTVPGPTSFANTATPIPSNMPGQARALPDMTQPDKKVWNSTYGGGTVVTLHHKNHTEKYGIECAACHHAEGCGSCHHKQGSVAQVSHSEEALHAVCNGCHAEMSCDQCHQKSEAASFSHSQTGWPLNKPHSKLKCRACHGDPYHFTKPDRECSSCHDGWKLGSFKHGVTGITLDDNHKEIECETCHVNKAYGKKPVCTECHGAEFAYPDKIPGTKAGSKRR
jgi:hypothetical protein